MLITCISASNTKLMGENSTSTKVCGLKEDIIRKDYKEGIEVNTVSLVNYNFKSCILCGSCAKTNTCVYDEDFNEIYSKMGKSDGVFFVVPHYSPIPSKLIMIFEKINEIMYAGWINDQNFTSPITQKAVGVIGHGGCPENDEILKYYHDNLIAPVARTLKSLSFNVIGVDEEFKYGAAFGLRDKNCYEKVENSVFPGIIQDWDHIEKRIRPLVKNVIDKALGKSI
jgi:multimeric flavodoxin WrbA